MQAVQAITPSQTTLDWAGELGRWMILASGLAVLVVALILPAQADLHATQEQRDYSLHIENSQHARISRYMSFLNQLDAPSQATIDLLAMSQLGLIPKNRTTLDTFATKNDPRIFEILEPTPVQFISTQKPASRLEKLTTSQDTQLWVILIGAVAVMYGLLPATKS